MRIHQADLARRDETVPRDLGALEEDREFVALDRNVDPAADEGTRHAVAGTGIADGPHGIHRASMDLAQRGAQRGQPAQEVPLGNEALGRDRRDLGMDPAVHLGAPGDRRLVGQLERAEGCARDHQVALGIADEVLDHALGFGIGRLAEVGPEAIVTGEGDVRGCRHHDVGHHPALEATHPVGEHDRGHAAQGLEALAEEAQGRRLALVEGEPDEPPAAPGEDGAEHLEATDLAPVDDEVLTRHGLPRPVRAALAAMLGLGLRHGPAQMPRGTRIALRPAEWQQALGADPAVGRADPRLDERCEPIGHLGPRWPWRRRPGPSLDEPADGLVGRAAQRRRGAVRAQLLERGQDVQLLPRTLHNGCPSGWLRAGFDTATVPPRGRTPVGQIRRGVGTFRWPYPGTLSWPRAPAAVFAVLTDVPHQHEWAKAVGRS